MGVTTTLFYATNLLSMLMLLGISMGTYREHGMFWYFVSVASALHYPINLILAIAGVVGGLQLWRRNPAGRLVTLTVTAVGISMVVGLIALNTFGFLFVPVELPSSSSSAGLTQASRYVIIAYPLSGLADLAFPIAVAAFLLQPEVRQALRADDAEALEAEPVS